MSAEFFEEVARLLRQGRRVAVATVIQTSGSTPRKAGARMGILEDGAMVGSVGGGALEALVLEDARALLATGGTAVHEYSLREGDHPGSTGMVCGGNAKVHLQVEIPPERLLVFGGGHVGEALARVACELDFDVTVLDDRPGFLDPSRFPASVSLRTTGPDFSGELPDVGAGTYVAIVTRCHRTDLAALRRMADSPASYVGLIGSRRKIRVVMDQLRREGTPGEVLERVHAPIGLPIGACTPQEIAVSIAGEMIRVRRASDPSRSDPGPVPIPRPAESHRRLLGRDASPSSSPDGKGP
jgi:xanthine dehydrogenase accessory factor